MRFVSSWVTQDLDRCYQVVECDRPAPLEQWMDEWGDLVDFEIQPVLTSGEAQAAALGEPEE